MALSSFPTLLLFLLLSTTTKALHRCSDPPSTTSGVTELSVLHVQSPCSPSPSPTQPLPGFDSIQGQARRDPARLSYLASLIGPRPTTVPVASGQQVLQTTNYIVRTKIGTPGQLLFMALDTSSDSTWVPSSACTGCPASAITFSPTASSTYLPLNCSSPSCPQFNGPQCVSPDTPQTCTYTQGYGGNSFVATLSYDSLTLASDVVPNYTFGCVTAAAINGGGNMPKQGLLGLGRGPTSLLSQAGTLYNGVFSYCLPSYKSYYFSGSLRLGTVGQPQRIRTTPLLRNPHRPSLYYVNLTGISVGKVVVAVPDGSFGFDPATGAGTIVDAGTVITRFVASAYAAIRDEFRKQVGASGYSSLGAFDTCFSTDEMVTAPAVTLHFEGADLVLPAENVLIHSSATPLACLAMAAAPENVNSVVNVIANLQQQNLRVLFDVLNSRVGFAREVCN